ncbi:MAG: exo-alpha-sialidase [Planctomycetaceae bacterium]|nr:exo-alpha-sialidase [Planctomycetaceae bacterium]
MTDRVSARFIAMAIALCLTRSLAEGDRLFAAELDLTPPDPITHPQSQLMLNVPGIDPGAAEIDFAALPVLEGRHTVVTKGDEQWQFRLHEYLAWFGDRYWCIWSHGPVIEDKATQHVQYATSIDGLNWSEPQILVGPPEKEGYGYIARGLWIRDGELIALASLFEAPLFRSGVLHLDAFRWDSQAGQWTPAGRVRDDSMNNFAPKQIADGNWMMSRRTAARDVSMMIGGVRSLTDWEIIPLATYTGVADQRPEEPYWYVLPDGTNIVGLFRNNNDSKRLLRAFSSDNGRTWSPLVETNFPDARSKFNAVWTSGGYFALVSNPNPQARNPLCLSVSRDGLVYTNMAVLPIDSAPSDSLQYPHVIEHDGHLLITFSRNKRTVEVLKIPLANVDALLD